MFDASFICPQFLPNGTSILEKTGERTSDWVFFWIFHIFGYLGENETNSQADNNMNNNTTTNRKDKKNLSKQKYIEYILPSYVEMNLSLENKCGKG